MTIRIAAATLIAMSGVWAMAASARWNPLGERARVSSSVPAGAPPASGWAVTDSAWAVRAPFRRTRIAAATRFDPRIDPADVSAPPAVRPTLSLKGIAFGKDPTGIVEGLPGTEGARAVRPGERIGALRVVRVTAALVEIRGPDTTWILRLSNGASHGS